MLDTKIERVFIGLALDMTYTVSRKFRSRASADKGLGIVISGLSLPKTLIMGSGGDTPTYWTFPTATNSLNMFFKIVSN